MGFFHTTGDVVGHVSGFLLGEPVKFFGRMIGSDFFQEIGTDLQKGSIITGQTFGKLGSGSVNTAKGLITKQEYLRVEGLKELYDVMERTANGLETLVVHTAQNSKDIMLGVIDRDPGRLYLGTKGIIKKVTIGSITVGVIDGVMNGIDQLEVTTETQYSTDQMFNSLDVTEENSSSPLSDAPADEYIIQTVNDDISGSVHNETGIPYKMGTIELTNGNHVTGVFPDFQETAAVSIPEVLYLESDFVQFETANSSLANQLELNPELKQEFTSEQLDQIQMGETPDGYVWHHHEIPGRLELVPEEIHANSGHTGGRFIWGGGTEYR